MTLRELYDWIDALGKEKVISASQRAKLLFDHSPGDESYAFHKGTSGDGALAFWKGGGHPGFESQLLWYPERDVIAIVFINKNMGLRKRLFPDLRKLIEDYLVEPDRPVTKQYQNTYENN